MKLLALSYPPVPTSAPPGSPRFAHAGVSEAAGPQYLAVRSRAAHFLAAQAPKRSPSVLCAGPGMGCSGSVPYALFGLYASEGAKAPEG